MHIEFVEALDLGNFGRQRLVFRCRATGNLLGRHLLQGNRYLYTFPALEVKVGDFVVVYMRYGQAVSQKFPDATCHFFYCGKWTQLWEDPAPSGFRITGKLP